MTLSTIAAEQAKVTEVAMDTVEQLLDYCTVPPNAKLDMNNLIWFSTFTWMPLTLVHLRLKAELQITFSRMVTHRQTTNQIKWTSTHSHTHPTIYCCICCWGRTWCSCCQCQRGKKHHLILEIMGHTQSPTPIHCDNSNATGITNYTVKMEMQYFWITDQVAQNQFTVHWHPDQVNHAYYSTKHHPAAHHTHVRPYHLHMDHSPTNLLRPLLQAPYKGVLELLFIDMVTVLLCP